MQKTYLYTSLTLIVCLFINFKVFYAQENEGDCVIWAVVEDNQAIQYDLLTGDRISTLAFEKHIGISSDGRYLISHTFDDGVDIQIRTNIQTGATARIDIERHDGEFPTGSIELSSELIILNYNTPSHRNPQMSEMSSRRLIDWNAQESNYFPYYSGRIGIANDTGHIGLQWRYDDNLYHDDDFNYEKFAWFSFENKSLSFSSTDNLSNSVPINLSIPIQYVDNTSWDWSDAYGFIWYEEFGEFQGEFAWLIGESQPINLELEPDDYWGTVRISPNGQYLLQERHERVWVYELESQEIIYQIAIEHRIGSMDSRWIDDRQILFITSEVGQTTFHIVQIDTGEERVFHDNLSVYAVVVPETNNCN